MDGKKTTGIAGRVRVVVPTHMTNKLKKNADIGPPNTGLIQQTLNSLLFKVSAVFEQSVPITIVYNAHIPTPNYLHTDPYYQALQKLCETNNFLAKSVGRPVSFNVIGDLSPGYKGVRCGMANWVKEDYVFVLEHDWEFLETIDLELLIATMDIHPHINCVRFNKRNNVSFVKNMASGRPGGDICVCQDDELTFPMCITQQYSNNPHVERVSKLREWARIAGDSTIFEGKNGGAGGFEHPLQEASFDDYQHMGITGHSKRWGLYLYGAYGAGPYVQHIGI